MKIQTKKQRIRIQILILQVKDSYTQLLGKIEIQNIIAIPQDHKDLDVILNNKTNQNLISLIKEFLINSNMQEQQHQNQNQDQIHHLNLDRKKEI